MKISKNSKYIKKKIFWIDPRFIKLFSAPPNWWWYARLDKRIQNKAIKEFIRNIAMGKVYYGGSWDIKSIPFEKTDWVQKIKDFFSNIKNFQESHWYISMANQINRQGFCYHKNLKIISISELDSFFESHILELIKSLTKNGYLLEDTSSNDVPKVLIGRNGELIKSGNGCHRLAIMQKLDLNFKFPIQIIAIHKKLDHEGVDLLSQKLGNLNDIF